MSAVRHDVREVHNGTLRLKKGPRLHGPLTKAAKKSGGTVLRPLASTPIDYAQADFRLLKTPSIFREGSWEVFAGMGGGKFGAFSTTDGEEIDSTRMWGRETPATVYTWSRGQERPTASCCAPPPTRTPHGRPDVRSPR